jgi:glucokinase
MYIGLDIGGTKILLASLDEQGVITEKQKFPTPRTYTAFLKDIAKAAEQLSTHTFAAGAVGVPGEIDRNKGTIIALGNLPWHHCPIQADLEDIFHCPIVIENDAKLAALSEAMLLKDNYKKVLYITISTGIGVGLVVNGIIDTNLADAGGKAIMLENEGKIESWEDFASGRAIVARFGKQASDITDMRTWRIICRDIAKGLIHLIAITEPDVIVIGGGVGTYFSRYSTPLKAELEKYQLPLIKLPALIKAQRPEKAVVFGCYDLAKQVFTHA